jgi:hypothetical protein
MRQSSAQLSIMKSWNKLISFLVGNYTITKPKKSQLSRPIKIQIEISLHVEMSFFKLSRILSRLRLLIKTMSKIKTLGHRDCRDVIFQTVKNFLTVEMSVFKLLRISRRSRPRFLNCWECLDCQDLCFWTVQIQEPWLRARHDKSRPPGLVINHKTFLKLTTYLNKDNLNIVCIILDLKKSNDTVNRIHSNILLQVCLSVRLGNWYFV